MALSVHCPPPPVQRILQMLGPSMDGWWLDGDVTCEAIDRRSVLAATARVRGRGKRRFIGPRGACLPAVISPSLRQW